MKHWLMGLLGVMTLTFVVGCGQIVAKIEQLAGDDFKRTSELAAKYGKPEVKQCADFIVAQIAKLKATDGVIASLRAEDTNGLFSTALKAALIAEALKGLQDVNGPQFKAEFKAACSSVAGDMLFNLMSDAAKFRGR